MPKTLADKKGVVLLIVLATVLVTTILAGVILSIISSQYKLAHHQVSRIQAYYACQAGVNFAKERLRTRDWLAASSCLPPGGCDLNDADFPSTIVQPIKIIIIPSGSAGCLNPPSGSAACINATVTYPSS